MYLVLYDSLKGPTVQIAQKTLQGSEPQAPALEVGGGGGALSTWSCGWKGGGGEGRGGEEEEEKKTRLKLITKCHTMLIHVNS